MDGGMSWVKNTDGNGFSIDPSVYGYPGGCELSDGSIYCVYYDGWNKQVDTGVWAIRFRIRADSKSIQLLPVPGAPAYDEYSHNTFTPGERPTGDLDIDDIGRKK
jgi:hypothetical protein